MTEPVVLDGDAAFRALESAHAVCVEMLANRPWRRRLAYTRQTWQGEMRWEICRARWSRAALRATWTTVRVLWGRA